MLLVLFLLWSAQAQAISVVHRSNSYILLPLATVEREYSKPYEALEAAKGGSFKGHHLLDPMQAMLT